MEASSVVYRPLPRVPGAGIDDHSVVLPLKPSRAGGNFGGFGVRFPGSRSRATVRKYPQSGFSDEGYVKYYNSPGIVCSGGIGATIVEEIKEEKKKQKLMKKKLKLLKGLCKDLSSSLLSDSNFGSDPDNRGLLDQIRGNMMSDTTEVLLTQLRQQLKQEEKELKRKRKEVKAMKKAGLVQKNKLHCEASSSSSSESSDSECGKVVDMSRLKNQVLAPPPPPTGNELQLEQSSPVTSSSSTTTTTTIGHEFDSGSRINVAVVDSGGVEGSVTKKIEVCMGGKCKKSGAASLIEEFNKVLGSSSTAAEAVVGCKCMGKCRSAPNVRVSNNNSTSEEAQTKSLCIGVGLDDVRTIVANLLEQTRTDVGGFAAAASWSGAM